MANINHNSQKFYDRISFFYPVIDLFLKPQKGRFFSEINRLPRGRVLEVGVGNGAHFSYYKKHEVVGIDTSHKMLALANKKAKENIVLIQMSGENLLFPNQSFDYVILSHVIAVVENPEKLMEEVHRVLKPNGRVLILNHFTPTNWLKYLDRLFGYVSKLFYFKSVFHISTIRRIANFHLQKELNAGLFSYFKILIYEKKS